MRSKTSQSLMAGWPLFLSLTLVSAQTSGLKPLVNKGCFTSSGGLTDQGSYIYQAAGHCQRVCVDLQKPVMATSQGSNCWCGDFLPATNSKVSDSQCNSPCNGYDKDFCGGPSAWNVQLTGLNNNVGSQQSSNSDSNSDPNLNAKGKSDSNKDSNAPAVTSATSSPKPTSAPSVVTTASTIVVTAPGQTTAQETTIITKTDVPQPNSPNKVGIAAGVVGGIVALTAIAGGVFFFLRNRRKRSIEEEYRRNVASGYGSKPPDSSAASTLDSRLEPSVMMQNRQSDGSIADNQDYSRRILKITNPDGT